MRRRAFGFTLIELLVVVAIIALLIAILLPSLARAKANAVRVKCAAQLRAWGSVITLYTHENNDQFGIGYPDPSGTKHSWASLSVTDINLYQSEWNSFAADGQALSQEYRTCPGDPQFGVMAAAGAGKGNIAQGITGQRPPIDYCMPRYLPVISSQTMVYRMNQCNHPYSAVLMLDANPSVTGGISGYINFTTMADLDAGGTAEKDALMQRHLGIGNVLFMDDHVEAHSYADYQKNIPATTISGGPNTFVAAVADRMKVWTTFDTQ